MIFNYCPDCGSKAEQRIIGDEGAMSYCAACERPLFPVSYTCILTLIVDENGNFAFIQQNHIPPHLYMGVAGYPQQGETFEETVKREVLEEVGLIVQKVSYIKSYCHPSKDMVMLGFVSEVQHAEFKLSTEVDNAAWFSKADAPQVLRENSIIARLFYDYADQCKENYESI